MAIIDNIPIELPYYGLKWSTFYTNIHDKRIDLNIYKKNFTGLVLGTENDLALATENRYYMLSPECYISIKWPGLKMIYI